MLKIKLSKPECTYLCSEDQANEIRDLCGAQIAGFDEKYELTHEGEILESLIDIG